jgi:AraC family transcriptional regulator
MVDWIPGETMRETTLEDYERRMLRVLVFIQQNLDRELPLEELAAVAHFSPYHFHRVFRGMVGETLQAHIRRIRLERAAQRLLYTRDSVTTIAFESGYTTHEAFTRAFRSMTGRAPSTFRRERVPNSDLPAPSHVHYAGDDRLTSFTSVETGGPIMDVTIKTIEPMRVAFMRHIGPYSECGKTWDKFLPRLGSAGLLGPAASIIGICHDDPEVTPPEKVRYDCCVTVDDQYTPDGGIGVQIIDGGDYAVTTHHGPYTTIGDTYSKLCGQWIPRNNRRFRAAPCFEIYLNDPESTEPDELLTDIYAPLEPR